MSSLTALAGSSELVSRQKNKAEQKYTIESSHGTENERGYLIKSRAHPVSTNRSSCELSIAQLPSGQRVFRSYQALANSGIWVENIGLHLPLSDYIS